MSLQYNVSQLLKSEVGSTRTYEFDFHESLDLGDVVATGISGRVKFTLTNFGVLAGANAQAGLGLVCARCVEPCISPVTISFEEEYQPTVDIASGLAWTAPRSDSAFEISDNHTIDLTEALRQNLLLAVEIVPLCSADCKGLCATCGANLNNEPCICSPPEESSPFAVLQGLLGGQASHE
ncbi:MAG: hypothetical protein PVSMB7_10840 [Chloroflexota bacterium]